MSSERSEWEGRECWFTVLKGMKGNTYVLTEENPKKITRAEGRRTYSDEEIIFTVQLDEAEKKLDLIMLRNYYEDGIRPGFELRQNLEYGGA